MRCQHKLHVSYSAITRLDVAPQYPPRQAPSHFQPIASMRCQHKLHVSYITTTRLDVAPPTRTLQPWSHTATRWNGAVLARGTRADRAERLCEDSFFPAILYITPIRLIFSTYIRVAPLYPLLTTSSGACCGVKARLCYPKGTRGGSQEWIRWR